MSKYFVMEICAVRYEEKNNVDNIKEVNNFIEDVVGDVYYVKQEGKALRILRKCDDSSVLRYPSFLYPGDYLIYNNVTKEFCIIEKDKFIFLPKEEYLAKNLKKNNKKTKKVKYDKD